MKSKETAIKFNIGYCRIKNFTYLCSPQMNMVPIVQLVRASDCGSECRGFESHWAPKKEVERLPFFVGSGDENPGS